MKELNRLELIHIGMMIALAFLAIVFVYKYSEAATAYNLLVDKYEVCLNNSLVQPIRPSNEWVLPNFNLSIGG